MNQFRVTACVRVDSRWFGRYAEMHTAFFKQVLADTPHSNIDKNKIPVLRYRKLKTAWNDDIRLKISCL